MGADYLSYLQSGMSGNNGASQMSGAFGTVLNPNSNGAQKIEGVANAGLNLVIGQLLANVNADKDAEKDVKKGEQEVDDINKAKDTAAQKNKDEVQKILDQIEKNYKDAKEKAKELDDLNEKKQEIEKKLDEAYAIIEANKSKVNGPEQQAALMAISKAGETIRSLQSELNALIKPTEQAQEEAKETTDNNEKLQDNAVDLTQRGEDEQKQYSQQLTTQTAKNTQLLASAAYNTQAAVQAEAKIAALETGVVAGGIVTAGAATVAAEPEIARLHEVVVSNTKAAAIKTDGTGRIATYIAGAVQGISGNIGDGTQFLNTLIGSATDANYLCFNIYDTANALGSMFSESNDALTTDGQNLQAATDSAQRQISANESNGNDEDSGNVTFEFEQEYNVA